MKYLEKESCLTIFTTGTRDVISRLSSYFQVELPTTRI